MTSVSKEGKLIKVRFDKDDWMRGIVTAGSAYTYTTLEGDGLTYVVSVDPFRHLGYLQPGFEYAEVTNMSSITNNKVIENITNTVSGDGSAYGIENSTQFHQINALSGAITDDTNYPYTLAGTSPVGSDVITYSISGTEYVFASYNEATNGYIARLDVATGIASGWTDPFSPATGSLTLNKNYAHPMIVGDDDILYIANGNEIVAYDGVADVASTLTFSVPDGLIITSFAKTPNYLAVFCSTKTSYDAAPGTSYCFFWDYSSEDATYRYDLNCAYVNGAFTYKGTVGVFGQRQGFTRSKSLLMLFNGSIFETVESFQERIPSHGGVDIMDELIIWNAGDFTGLGTSRVYTYGSVGKGYPNSLQKIGAAGGLYGEGVLFASGSAYTSGYLVSSKNGGELNLLSGGYSDSSLVYSALKDIDFGRYGFGKVVDVKVVYKSKITDGASFDLILNTDSNPTTIDQRGSPTYLVNNATTQETLVQHYLNDYQGLVLPEFSNSIGFSASWGSGGTEAHAIHSIEIFIEPITSPS
jgi:hypothetical protein